MTKAYKYERVLIIDDDELGGLITAKLLQLYGVVKHPIRMNTAQMALDHLASIQDEPHNLPEIILLDLYMPEMNGLQFLEAYDSLPNKRKNVILLTALALPTDQEQALKSPLVLMVLNKPISRDVAKTL